jgi:proteasome lid subunit RPN8/RPN11
MLPVIIEMPCFFTIAASCMEVFNRETSGFLLGKERYRRLQKNLTKAMVLEVACPLQTAHRKPSEVEPGNIRAHERVKKALKSMEYEIIGEYHSHPNYIAKPSKYDIEYAEDRETRLKLRGAQLRGGEPLELIVAISRRSYESPHKIGWTFHDYSKKAGAVFVLYEYIGYKITLGAYWLKRFRGRLRPVETEIFIPWWKGYWSK